MQSSFFDAKDVGGKETKFTESVKSSSFITYVNFVYPAHTGSKNGFVFFVPVALLSEPAKNKMFFTDVLILSR